MNSITRLVPLFLIAGGVAVFLILYGFNRFMRAWKKRQEKSSEADLMLNTVDLMIRGVRESESDMRDLYSKAEKRAAFLERYHHSILESMETGVLACNRQGQITAINGAASRILNLEEGSANGKELDEALGRRNLFGRILQQLLRSEPVDERIELKLKRSGDEPKWIELRTSVLRGKNGQVAGATFMLDEITDRKMMRRQIELKDRLAAMGEVSAGIAHEFRNALHALNGLAKLITRRAAGDERVEPIAREILEENKRLETTLNELLSFLKPQGIQPERIEIREFLQSLVLPFREMEANRAIRFHLSIGDNLPAMRADRAMLIQAIRNLVQNAVIALAGEGEVTIRVSMIHPNLTGMKKKAKEYFVLSVCDTGPGISKEVQEKIFRPFFTTRSEGTGLGLSVVQKVVASHGGCLEMENDPHGGAIFTIFLPAGTTSPTTLRTPAATAATPV